NYKCRDCGRQFVEDPQWKPKDKNTFSMIELLLLEKMPLAGIARVTKVSESWLQDYVNQFYRGVSKRVDVVPKAKGKLKVQMDELWSFVDSKDDKQWVWIALDVDTREVVGCYIGGKRSHAVGLSHEAKCKTLMAVDACSISAVRDCLHRLLGVVCRRHTEQSTPCSRQRQRSDKLRRTI
ncbi:MAG: IS1 family transposase, partial [Cyanobacteria bacterium J06614_10]